MNNQAIDIQMVVSVLGKPKTVRIRKQAGEDRLDVQDTESSTRVAYFPADALSNLINLTQSIQEHMTISSQGTASPKATSPKPAPQDPSTNTLNT